MLSFPIYIISKEISKQDFRICYTGDVADELFATYSDVVKYCWREDDKWYKRRLSLTRNVGDKNLKNINMVGMLNGVEFRSPFANKDLVDFCLKIPPKYRDDKTGKIKKYLLRKAFENELPKDIIWRKKVPLQVGYGGEKLLNDI